MHCIACNWIFLSARLCTNEKIAIGYCRFFSSPYSLFRSLFHFIRNNIFPSSPIQYFSPFYNPFHFFFFFFVNFFPTLNSPASPEETKLSFVTLQFLWEIFLRSQDRGEFACFTMQASLLSYFMYCACTSLYWHCYIIYKYVHTS